ncbi:hypothetical protein LXL04_017482 [Taraxacum kok-saghyz]
MNQELLLSWRPRVCLPFPISKPKPINVLVQPIRATLQASIDEKTIGLTAKEKRELRNVKREENKSYNLREDVEEKLLKKPKKQFNSWKEELNLDKLAVLGPQWWIVKVSRARGKDTVERMMYGLAKNFPDAEFKCCQRKANLTRRFLVRLQAFISCDSKNVTTTANHERLITKNRKALELGALTIHGIVVPKAKAKRRLKPDNRKTIKEVLEESTESHRGSNSNIIIIIIIITRENLKEWVDNVARTLGYVVVTKRSKTKISGYVSKIILRYKYIWQKYRDKKINCPFELVGVYYKTYDFWTLTVKNSEHNHDPAMYMEGHAFAKRLTKDERRMVEDMTDNNVPRVRFFRP